MNEKNEEPDPARSVSEGRRDNTGKPSFGTITLLCAAALILVGVAAIGVSSSSVQFVVTGVGFVIACGASVLLLRARNKIAGIHQEIEAQVELRTAALREANARLEQKAQTLVLAEEKTRKDESYLRTVLASSPIILWAVDMEGVLKVYEGGALHMAEEKYRPKVGKLQSETMRGIPRIVENTQRALSGESFSMEQSFRSHWYNTRFAPLRDGSGEIIGALGVVTDITARKIAEQMASTEEGARQAARLHSEFLASMGHEIRTPMNGIVGMTDLLNQTPLSEDQRGMIDVIQSSATALLVAVTDILELSRLESGKVELINKKFNLLTLVEDTLVLQNPAAHGKGLELINDFDSSMPTEVMGDAVRIRQIITNLLGNAIKFSEKGHVLVSVRKKHQNGQRLGLHITIADTGIGIAPAMQEQLLKPFTPGDASAARRIGGTGLGLAITKQLVDLMGGKIGFSSKEGEGSAFWIELDLPCVTEASGSPSVALRAGTRLLVLDDNETTRGIIALRLSAKGAIVDIAEDSNHAFHSCVSKASDGNPYDAVIVDRYMPGVDGLQFARMVRGNPAISKTALVLLTPDGVSDHGIDKGLVQAFADKPLREAQLLRAIAIAQGHEKTEASPAKGVRAPQQGNAALRLLLAEDNFINQKVASRILTNLGHRVDVANDGIEALKLIETRVYDAVLMDCQMPGLDGCEVTRRVRSSGKAWSKLWIIAVTANSTPADRQQCFDAGMDDFVAKPIRTADLDTALARAVPSRNQA